MNPKPTKPDKKIVAPIKELDVAIKKSQKTKADTKALTQVNKELKDADKALFVAMGDLYRAFDKSCKETDPLLKPPSKPGPVPIPYPIIAKAKKSTNAALGKLQKAQKKHDKVSTKLIKTLGKEIKVLQSEAKKSSGDEAGTLKGLISAKNMADTKMTLAASKVKFEGKNVVRHLTLVDNAVKKIEKKQGK